MTSLITFDIPGRPVPKGRPRFDPRSGRIYTPAKTAAYEKEVAYRALASGLRLKRGMRVRVECVAYLGRRPWGDADNYCKVCLDGLQLAYKPFGWNDRDVVSCAASIRPAPMEQFLRVTVEIVEDQCDSAT